MTDPVTLDIQEARRFSTPQTVNGSFAFLEDDAEPVVILLFSVHGVCVRLT